MKRPRAAQDAQSSTKRCGAFGFVGYCAACDLAGEPNRASPASCPLFRRFLGVSGISGDMRELRRAAPRDPEARLAIAMFCQSARKHIAALVSVLGGVDLLVFTGGIGENDAEARASIFEGMAGLGVNRIITLPSDEAQTIAWHTREPTINQAESERSLSASSGPDTAVLSQDHPENNRRGHDS